MAFGPSTYLKNAYHAEIEWGWYYNSSDQVVILWDSVVQYQGSVVLLNPYRSFTDGDAFPGADGNNYAIGDYEDEDGPYYYFTPTSSSTTYAAGYEYYGVRQEVASQPDLPTVNITSVDDTTPNENTSDQVTATTTTDSSATISSYAWSSSGGITFSSTTLQSPTITFPDVAVNTAASITCVVTDSLGATASDTQNYTIQAATGTGTYGIQIFDSSQNLMLDVADTVGFISATTTFALTSADGSSGTKDIPASGAKVGDKASMLFFTLPIGDPHFISPSVVEADKIRITYQTRGTPRNGGYQVFSYNLGDS